MPEVIVFTDLDGTLLDHDSYSVRAALSAVDLLVRRGMPIIPVSSKTASEIRHWIRILNIDCPFVSENGCGVNVPVGSFARKPEEAVEQNGMWHVSLGRSVTDVSQALEKLSEEAGFNYRSLEEMSQDELSSLTGLAGEELQQCMAREYDVPFIINGQYDEALISTKAAEKGYHFTRGGRFFHLTGGCHKGTAVRFLADHYRMERPGLLMVAIGDSVNDIPMFQEVDLAYLVKRPDGTYDPDVRLEKVKRANGIGPAGWRAAIEEVMTFDD